MALAHGQLPVPRQSADTATGESPPARDVKRSFHSCMRRLTLANPGERAVTLIQRPYARIVLGCEARALRQSTFAGESLGQLRFLGGVDTSRNGSIAVCQRRRCSVEAISHGQAQIARQVERIVQPSYVLRRDEPVVSTTVAAADRLRAVGAALKKADLRHRRQFARVSVRIGPTTNSRA